MRLISWSTIVVALSGCQAVVPSGNSAALPALAPPSVDVAAAAAAGGSTGMMPAAAKAWIECGLRAYYTAATPITAYDSIEQCRAEGRRYQDIYFAEYGYPASGKARYYIVIERRAASELSAIISGEAS